LTRRLAGLLAAATDRLAEAGVPSPRVDAELIAAHLLEMTPGRLRAAVLTGPLAAADDAFADRFDLAIGDRARRLPLQHITGTAPFRGLELGVGPGVFIPRPETEQVAGQAIATLRGWPSPIAVDLCAGSGAIAAAIAAEVPGARVIAVEISAEACAWAERNLAGSGVELIQADARTALPDLDGQVDLVVSNPPYIPPGARPLDPEVALHDPALALYGGGSDGLELPAGIVRRAAALLKPSGVLVMEHGEAQGEQVRALLADDLWSAVETLPDLAGRPRLVRAARRAPIGTCGRIPV
jgi:release factor glutamine methyltransferase